MEEMRKRWKKCVEIDEPTNEKAARYTRAVAIARRELAGDF